MHSQVIERLCTVVFAVFTLTGCSTTGASLGSHRAHTVAWAPERNPEVRSLLKARYDAAVSAYKTERYLKDSGLSTTEFTLRLAAETPEQLIQARAKHLEITKQFELEAQQRLHISRLTPSSEEALTRCWRLAAEIDLLRAKRQFQK